MSFQEVANEQKLEAQIAALKAGGGTAFFATGDADVDAALAEPMAPKSSNQTAFKTIYDTETGEPREIPVTLLGKTLIKRRNGKPAFSLTPLKEFVRGEVMCFLHPDHPDYNGLRAVGLGGKVCGGGETPPAAHLMSEFDRDLHMQHRHAREWAVLKEYRERKEREEERDLRRQEIQAMQAMAAQGGGTRKAG